MLFLAFEAEITLQKQLAGVKMDVAYGGRGLAFSAQQLALQNNGYCE